MAPTADAETRNRSTADAAFSALAERHARLLYRVAFSLLRNPQDAEDAVQETLLKLYRNDAWHGLHDDRAFLARAVWRAGLDKLSTAGAKAMRHAEDVHEMQIASQERTPEEHAMDQSERTLMRTLIEALPEIFRQPLVLSAIEGMKTNEVAAVLGIPEATVRTRIFRAKADLRERFLATMATRKEVRP